MSDKPLIVAIDGDTAQAARLQALVRAELSADLVQAPSVGEGLLALEDRVPDLVLTSPLLSPFDEGVLDEYLRALGPKGAHVQTLRIPVLDWQVQAPPRASFSFRRRTPAPPRPDGCDPTIFAREIAQYLGYAERERAAAAVRASDSAEPTMSADADEGQHDFAAWHAPDGTSPPARGRSLETVNGSFQEALAAVTASWNEDDKGDSPRADRDEPEAAYEIDLSDSALILDHQAQPDAAPPAESAYEMPASRDQDLEEAMTASGVRLDD